MSSIFDFEVKDKDGSTVSLSTYSGKKAYIIVNVASACGYTASNYQELVNLYGKYQGDLEILAFPCNNFGRQESGTMDEICSFVARKGGEFPVFGKLDQESSDITNPLYTFLKEKTGTASSKIAWNFEKFLVNGDGIPVKRYPSKMSAGFIKDVEDLIKA